MEAVMKKTLKVLPGHVIELDPGQFAVGDTVEVEVRKVEKSLNAVLHALEEIHESLKNHPSFGTAWDVQGYINEERNSWDR